MLCATCGASLPNDSKFCTECGAPVQNHEPDTPPPSVEPQGKSAPKGALVAGAVAAVAVLAVAVGLFASGIAGGNGQAPQPQAFSSFQTSQSQQASSQAAPAQHESASSQAEADGAASSPEAGAPSGTQGGGVALSVDAVYEDGNLRATLPARLAGQGYAWNASGSESVALCDKDGTVVCDLVWGQTAMRQNEAKRDAYLVALANADQQEARAILNVYYLDEQGRHVYAGASDAASAGVSAEQLLGASGKEIVSWIELYDGGAFQQAVVVDPSVADVATDGSSGSSSSGEANASGGFSTPLTVPFYGVWVSASKDYDEALAIAQGVHVGGGTGSVFLTTDWSNLNPEPYYVVAAGFARSESEAQSLCELAQSEGYPDAYVKYSGDYLGPAA